MAGIITGCGGGGASAPDPVDPTPYSTSPPTTTPEGYFQDYTEYMMDDPWSVISQACNDSRFRTTPEAFGMIPVHLNDDNYMDFISHYWCSTHPGTVIADVPTPDVLVAHVSDGYGNWYIENYRIFGEDLPRIGGASRKWTKGDFNGDGYDDIAFAVNWEDMRANDLQGGRWDTQQTVLLSTGDYGYTIERVGQRSMGHAVGAKRNALGYDDVIFAGMLGTHFQAFRLSVNTGEWQDVTDEYPGNGDWAIDIQVVSDNQILAGHCEDSACGLGLFEQTQQGWTITDKILAGKPVRVFIDGQERSVHKVGNHYTVGIGTDEMCRLDNYNSTGTLAVAVELWGESFKEGIVVEEGYHYTQQDLENYRNLLVFEIVDGKLVGRHPQEPAHRYNAFFMECVDLDSDGDTDVFIQKMNRDDTYQTDPLIYMNYGGELVVYEVQDEDHFPDHTEVKSQQLWDGVSRLVDMDGDGIMDLITYTYHTDLFSNLEVYRGLKPLD